MRVLVTGGTGFIGRHLVHRLLATHTSDRIVCLVTPSVTAREAIAQQKLREAGGRLVEGDLNLPTVSRERLPQVDVVFHLAAKSDRMRRRRTFGSITSAAHTCSNGSARLLGTPA